MVANGAVAHSRPGEGCPQADSRCSGLGAFTGRRPSTGLTGRGLRQGLAGLLVAAIGATAAAERLEFDHGSFASVPFFPSSVDDTNQGFVRVINHSNVAGTVWIGVRDDTGAEHGPVTLRLEGGESVHFNSDDLEEGNADKGLPKGVGSGDGVSHLDLWSLLNIEVLSYVRTPDGFLTAMHDVVARAADGSYRVAIFNPGSNHNQVSLLRVVNTEQRSVSVGIRGIDGNGAWSVGAARLALAAGEARTVPAQELEAGGHGFEGALDDGAGKWQLLLEPAYEKEDGASPPPRLLVMSLLRSPTGHLANLSGTPADRTGEAHHIPFFPSAAGGAQRQGFLRIINHSARAGAVRIRAFDDAGRSYGELSLHIEAERTAHFNSEDLEMGNGLKGLPFGTGAGDGDWRLELSSTLDIEVLAYMRAAGGFLTAIHDVVPQAGNRYRVPIFNPGSNDAQVSVLRVVNPGVDDVEVTIRGMDGTRSSPRGEVRVMVRAGAARSLTAAELEAGAPDFDGRLGDGRGKWQLLLVSETPVFVMSLLENPTGHLTNLSAAPASHAYRDEFPGSPLMHVYDDTVVVLHVSHDVSTTIRQAPVYTTSVYEWFEDVFDFLILLPNVDSWFSAMDGAAGWYEAVMNDTRGIGRSIFFDNRYGSSGKLRGVVTMAQNRALLHGPALHELQHAWANFTVPTSNQSHWGFSSGLRSVGGLRPEGSRRTGRRSLRGGRRLVAERERRELCAIQSARTLFRRLREPGGGAGPVGRGGWAVVDGGRRNGPHRGRAARVHRQGRVRAYD